MGFWGWINLVTCLILLISGLLYYFYFVFSDWGKDVEWSDDAFYRRD